MNKILLKKTKSSDSKLFYKIRFSADGIKYSLSKNIIKLKSHDIWFKNQIKNKKNIYYTIQMNNQKIGYIRLDFFDFYYEISIAGYKKFFKKNIFSSAFKLLENNSKNSKLLIAKVNKKNSASIKFFKKNNFILIKENKKILFFSKFLFNTKYYEIDKLVKKIENVRKENNVNWMDLLKLSFKNNPEETKNIFNKIKTADKKINYLSNKF